VVGEQAEVAQRAAGVEMLHLAGEDLALGSEQADVERRGHER
jgi:hypothetical protein